MKIFSLIVVLSIIATPALAQTRTYNKAPTPSTSSTRTYPNYVAPKSDFKKCTPVVVTEVNVFTKQPYQVVKCY